MKLVILISALALVAHTSMAQSSGINRSNKAACNTDSIFNKHFTGITAKLRSKQQFSRAEVDFSTLLEYLSGLHIINNVTYWGEYSISVTAFTNAQQWYEKNKRRIDCQKIKHGLALLQKPDVSDADEQELKSLKLD